MADARGSLAQHLQQWVHAYGPDFAVPPGATVARTATAAEPAVRAQLQTPQDVQGVSQEEITSQTTLPQRPQSDSPPGNRSAPSAQPGSKDKPQPTPSQTVTALRELRAQVLPCTRCKLHEQRQTTVFGEGDPDAEVMFIGEAPGAKEDQTGRPFVGPAGQLLDRILEGAMGLQRTAVFIANINKCRPPANRAPAPDEVAACLPYLQQQVEIIQPKVIVCLGRTAAQNLLGSTESTTALRRRQHEYCGIPVVVTWHPAYLLRDPSHKRETWQDIKQVNKLLGRPEVPPKIA